jgi:site-specific DNA-cytosine methylase
LTGGFALAASWVWPDHNPVLFCEREPFCQKVLRKHWPNVPIVEDVNDIESIIAYAKGGKAFSAESGGLHAQSCLSNTGIECPRKETIGNHGERSIDLLTGGFP